MYYQTRKRGHFYIVKKRTFLHRLRRGHFYIGLTGSIEYLLNRRLRHPYFGKVGRLSGKVQFGEALVDAAKRELFEETGLTAQTWNLEEMYRKTRFREDGTPVQDVFFYKFFVTDFSGTMIDTTPYQENFWATKHDVFSKNEFDPYDDLDLDERDTPQDFKLVEACGDAEGY